MIAAVWKPWYVFRPHQAVKRLVRTPPRGHRLVRTSWGIDLWVDPREHVGRSLWTTGVFDLAVSEVIFRITRPGDLVVDAGANLGYMTVLAAVASGPTGRVIAFEPNPRLTPWLRRNIDRAVGQFETASIEIRSSALGSYAHAARLVLPSPEADNEGLGHIVEEDVDQPGTAPAAVEALDAVLPDSCVGLLKIDVEGYESRVLEGSAAAIRSGRIRNIVFEEHHATGSAAIELLAAAGYAIFSIGWAMRGPVLVADLRHNASTSYEAPSYLASREPEAVVQACSTPGWRALRRRAHPRGHS